MLTIGSMALSVGSQLYVNVSAGVCSVASGALAFMTNTASTNEKFDLAMLEREKIDLNVKLVRLTMAQNQATMQATLEQIQVTLASMAQNQAVVVDPLSAQQVGQQQVEQQKQVGQQQVEQQQVGQQQVRQLGEDIRTVKAAIKEVQSEIDIVLAKMPQQPEARNRCRVLAAAIN